MRHRATALAAALIVALACSCSQTGPAPAGAASGVHIDTNTPQGLRAKQTIDMINSDWPIGTIGVTTLAAPNQIEGVASKLDRLWWDRPNTITGVDIGAGEATVRVVTSYGVAQTIELRTNAKGLVDRFDVTLQPPTINKWSDIDAALTKSGARYSYQASKVTDGKCTTVAGTNVDESLPLASMFKLYVLLAVANAVNAGTLSWTDPLIITADSKAVGSAGLDALRPGTTVPVREAAGAMISASDNMATDLLMAKVGRGAVERALAVAGYHDPASMTPFPTTHELFAIGWGDPDVREQWRNAVDKGRPRERSRLLAQTHSLPYHPDPERTHTPATPFGAEWYGSAADVCRVHAALQAAAVGPGAPVREILSALPGIELDAAKWGYIGAKGGNLPGDLTFSWYADDRTGQAWVVSFQLTWPEYRSQTAAAWLLSIAKRTFALIPVA